MSQLQELGGLVFEDSRMDLAVMEIMRKRLAEEFGVTVVGPYVTLRWREGRNLVQVAMLVTSITDSGQVEEEPEDK